MAAPPSADVPPVGGSGDDVRDTAVGLLNDAKLGATGDEKVRGWGGKWGGGGMVGGGEGKGQCLHLPMGRVRPHPALQNRRVGGGRRAVVGSGERSG